MHELARRLGTDRAFTTEQATWNCLALPQLLVTCVKDQFWYFVLFLYLEKSCLDQLKKTTLYLVTICDLSKKITCSSIILGMPPKADYWKYFNVVGVVAYCLIGKARVKISGCFAGRDGSFIPGTHNKLSWHLHWNSSSGTWLHQQRLQQLSGFSPLLDWSWMQRGAN